MVGRHSEVLIAQNQLQKVTPKNVYRDTFENINATRTLRCLKIAALFQQWAAKFIPFVLDNVYGWRFHSQNKSQIFFRQLSQIIVSRKFAGRSWLTQHQCKWWYISTIAQESFLHMKKEKATTQDNLLIYFCNVDWRVVLNGSVI